MKFYKYYKKLLKFRWLMPVAGLLLTACGPKAANLSILPASQGTFQGSTANNKVDILWVVDNSGSMLTKQQNLAAGFDSFASVFVNKDFDFHMAIVTTDTRSIGAGGQAGIFQGVPSVIANSTLNFSATFQSNVLVGQAGDSSAKALDAVLLSLDTPLTSGANTGFLRDGAHLAVIVLSDADDSSSTATTDGTLNFLNALKPDVFDVTSRTFRKNFTVSAVAVNSMTDPDCFDLDHDGLNDFPDADLDGIPDIQLYEEGVAFKSLVNSTNGSFASICKADFSAGLTAISQKIAEAITEIALARVPNVSTLAVYFNGVAIPNDATNGWTYVSTGNKIVFHGNFIPQDNTSIAINYIPNDIIR